MQLSHPLLRHKRPLIDRETAVNLACSIVARRLDYCNSVLYGVRKRRIRYIHRPVGQKLVAQLVHSFVLSRLDYGNSVLAGRPKSPIMPLQRIQNAAARLILDLRMNENVTPALRQLHLLCVDRRVDFKLCTMMYSIHTVSVRRLHPTWCVPSPSTR